MEFTKHNKAQVWSCGGGTQSCAIGALIVQGKLPKPDVSVIADTGYETQATWDYFNGVLHPALLAVGVDVVRVKASEWNKKRSELFWVYPEESNKENKDTCVTIPAFTHIGGETGKLKNLCTGNWKVETIDKFLSKSLGLTKSKIVKWIGFSRDETRRISKMMVGEDYKKGLIRFPLLSDFPTTRREAIKLVESMGWPTPPRSACWMCPNHHDNEWRLLKKERPDEFQKAVNIEKEIQLKDPDAWLHRSCKPLGEIDFTEEEDLFSRPCDSGSCFI